MSRLGSTIFWIVTGTLVRAVLVLVGGLVVSGLILVFYGALYVMVVRIFVK